MSSDHASSLPEIPHGCKAPASPKTVSPPASSLAPAQGLALLSVHLERFLLGLTLLRTLLKCYFLSGSFSSSPLFKGAPPPSRNPAAASVLLLLFFPCGAYLRLIYYTFHSSTSFLTLGTKLRTLERQEFLGVLHCFIPTAQENM